MEGIFRQVLRNDQITSDPEDLLFYGKDWTKEYTPAPSLILFPDSAEQVQEVVRSAYHEKIPLVPSGGRTGLSGGAVATKGEAVLSLERLRTIDEIDQTDGTIRCDAGVVLERVQRAAQDSDLLYPIDLTPRGTCQIGGTVATNAGGINVIRYGNTRNWVVGLTAISGSGEMMTLNGKLFKNQTGYDLRNLLIGSEGTLAVVVEATLALTQRPRHRSVLLCGTNGEDRVLQILSRARQFSLHLLAFEMFCRPSLELVLENHPLQDPFPTPFPTYALLEVEHPEAEPDLPMVRFYESLIEDEIVEDATISQSAKQFREFWSFRELIGETAVTHGVPHKNDLSVPIGKIPEFIAGLHELMQTTYPSFRVLIFGHVGDGNLHVNILKPEEMEREDFFKQCKIADETTFQLVRRLGGSISAEHGIGLLKRDFLAYVRSEYEIEIMRKMKGIFDPAGILNPGKLFPQTV